MLEDELDGVGCFFRYSLEYSVSFFFSAAVFGSDLEEDELLLFEVELLDFGEVDDVEVLDEELDFFRASSTNRAKISFSFANRFLRAACFSAAAFRRCS